MKDRLEHPSLPGEEDDVRAGFPPAELSRLALDQAPCGVLLLDGDANVLQANTTLQRWVGRGMRDTVGESELKDALGLDSTATHDAVLLAIGSVQKDLLPPSFELKLTRTDGSHMTLLAGASAVRSPAGDFLACALSFTDITARARQLEELLDSVERKRLITDRPTARQDMTAAKGLDKVMDDLNGELECRASESVRQYVVSNQDLDVFTHHITHDLRGPMRHINKFAGLMLEGVEGVNADGLETYRDGLRSACKQLNGMVEALFTYARIGRVDLHPAPMPLDMLIEGLITRVMQKYPDVEVSWTVHDDLPVVVGDPVLVTDLLSHMLDNAVKFSCKRPRPEVQIGWSQESEQWGQFFVVDNGVGFDVSKAKNLFVMFARQHHSLDFSGAGTGLALAQRIVQRHGGKIWADSTPDHGCSLHFTLPVEASVSHSKLSDLHL